LFIFESTKSGVIARVCKRFGRGSLGAIQWLVNSEVASFPGDGEERRRGGALGRSSLGCPTLNVELEWSRLLAQSKYDDKNLEPKMKH
jgi:hypothetical protein